MTSLVEAGLSTETLLDTSGRIETRTLDHGRELTQANISTGKNSRATSPTNTPPRCRWALEGTKGAFQHVDRHHSPRLVRPLRRALMQWARARRWRKVDSCGILRRPPLVLPCPRRQSSCGHASPSPFLQGVTAHSVH